MNMSDYVAFKLLELLEETGETEIRRNELAETLGCVPSQINYVISSRFTAEQGYIIESRRGGGGYIRITKIKMDKNYALTHTIKSIGNSLNINLAKEILTGLERKCIIKGKISKLIAVAVSDQTLMSVPPQFRDILRASIFKNMLLTLI